jgi:hypothetical protein
LGESSYDHACSLNEAQVEKRTSINSKSHNFTKEKEMADFRKWFLAFVVLALLSSLAIAQTSLTCNSAPAGQPLLRNEGVTELVGDLLINCSGGVATPAGAPVPTATIQLFVSNANITSRLLAVSGFTNFSEATMIVDEPHSVNGSLTPLRLCGDFDELVTGSGVCPVLGTGAPSGIGAGTYNGTAGHPNSFLARPTGQANSLQFNGVPFDPPGTIPTRTFRITNVRVNVSAVASSLVPQPVYMYLTISTSNGLNVNLPAQVVGLVLNGLQSNSSGQTVSVSKFNTFTQCFGQNPGLKGTDTWTSQATLTLKENFSSAWKPKNLAQYIANAKTTTVPAPGDAIAPNTGYSFLQYSGSTFAYGSGDINQNVVGAAYNSETGFLNSSANAEPSDSTGLTVAKFGSRGSFAGAASQGTRLRLDIANVPGGSSVWMPGRVFLKSQFTDAVTGVAALVAGNVDANGAGGAIVTALDYVKIADGAAGTAFYEILYSDPNQPEYMPVAAAVQYSSAPSSDSPKTGITGTANGAFAPTSTVAVADTSAPIPRFVPSGVPVNYFTIAKCSCNLLFPFVANTGGFDTGFALANTSVDPWAAATPQGGNVTIYYYSPGNNSSQRTTKPVIAGDILTWTLYGGNAAYGINGNPGFSGYVITSAEFRYCHAFAYLSQFGQPYSGEGYLGLVLDGGTNTLRTPYPTEQLVH